MPLYPPGLLMRVALSVTMADTLLNLLPNLPGGIKACRPAAE
jgi:hypothetical protein